MFVLSIIIGISIFTLIVLIHELGHFLSARRHGVHVEEFWLWIPPKAKVVYKDKKKCEYTLNWIPFWGFIRMEGEDEVNEKIRKSKTSFASKSILARMEIIMAGVFMNFVLAIILLTFLFTKWSTPVFLTQEDFNDYRDKWWIEIEKEWLNVTYVWENGPAYNEWNWFKVWDEIYEVNWVEVYTANEFIAFIEANIPMTVWVERTTPGNDKFAYDLKITPNSEWKIDAWFSNEQEIKSIKKLKLPVHKAFLYSLWLSKKITVATLSAFKNLVLSLFQHAKVPWNVAWPVGIFAMIHTIAMDWNFDALIQFTALISLSLAIMNSLPIPALDWWRFVFILIEAIIRKPIKPEWETWIHTISFFLLIWLIFIITWNDIYKLIINLI